MARLPDPQNIQGHTVSYSSEKKGTAIRIEIKEGEGQMTENRCPLIENCQQKSAVCNVQLPDETCYWFRWFRALDNPWHTGTPTEEGWYLIKFVIGKKGEEEVCYRTEKYKPSLYCSFDNMKWQKIEENEDGRTD